MVGDPRRRRDGSQYTINLDVKYAPLEPFDIRDVVGKVKASWFNQTLVRVNRSILRLGVIMGEFHWHRHRNDDELFFVLRGRLIVELRDRKIALRGGQGVVVPGGVMHRTRAPKRTVVLMVANAGIKPTGD